MIEGAGGDDAGLPAFLYEENHSLGEWFKKSLLAIM